MLVYIIKRFKTLRLATRVEESSTFQKTNKKQTNKKRTSVSIRGRVLQMGYPQFYCYTTKHPCLQESGMCWNACCPNSAGNPRSRDVHVRVTSAAKGSKANDPPFVQSRQPKQSSLQVRGRGWLTPPPIRSLSPWRQMEIVTCADVRSGHVGCCWMARIRSARKQKLSDDTQLGIERQCYCSSSLSRNKKHNKHDFTFPQHLRTPRPHPTPNNKFS